MQSFTIRLLAFTSPGNPYIDPDGIGRNVSGNVTLVRFGWVIAVGFLILFGFRNGGRLTRAVIDRVSGGTGSHVVGGGELSDSDEKTAQRWPVPVDAERRDHELAGTDKVPDDIWSQPVASVTPDELVAYFVENPPTRFEVNRARYLDLDTYRHMSGYEKGVEWLYGMYFSPTLFPVTVALEKPEEMDTLVRVYGERRSGFPARLPRNHGK